MKVNPIIFSGQLDEISTNERSLESNAHIKEEP